MTKPLSLQRGTGTICYHISLHLHTNSNYHKCILTYIGAGRMSAAIHVNIPIIMRLKSICGLIVITNKVFGDQAN